MKITEDFRIKKIDKDTVEYFYYDENGSLVDEDSKNICLSVTKVNNKSIYMAKLDRSLKLYNPLNKSNFYSLNKKDKTTGNNMFRLKEVSENAFNNYLKFLQTRQDSFLIVAERNL